MDGETLRKVQLAQLEILKKFKEICDRHGIRYILSSGTLLGAVRHKGFIPWDDDVDVDMMRGEYEKFLAVAPDELGDGFSLQTWESDKIFSLPYAKIRMNGTVYRENSVKKEGMAGIFIDVFPYDPLPEDEKLRSRMMFKFNLLRFLINEKTGHYEISKTTIKRKLAVAAAKVIVAFTSKKKLIKKYERASEKCRRAGGNVYFSHDGAGPIGSWKVAKDCFERTAELEFEGEMFSCPEDYDGYLREVYGDYMVLPPVGERENRHGITEVVFKEQDCVE